MDTKSSANNSPKSYTLDLKCECRCASNSVRHGYSASPGISAIANARGDEHYYAKSSAHVDFANQRLPSRYDSPTIIHFLGKMAAVELHFSFIPVPVCSLTAGQ